MENILVVEDSKTYAKLIYSKIKADTDFQCIIAHSMAEAKQVVDAQTKPLFLSILDLNLPDAGFGEIVDYALSSNIPAIIMTANFNDDIRDQIVEKDILDYIVKEGPFSLDHLITVIHHFRRNRKTKVLVVDDSRIARKHIQSLLKVQQFTTLEAPNGRKALELLEKNPDIKLVIIDYTMPEMDGFELTGKIRQMYPINRLAIIGISAYGNQLLSAKFLKKGANDFIIKPFLKEEFIWRVNQTLVVLEYIENVYNTATHDYLTGLYNKGYLLEIGEKLFYNAKRENLNITIAMIDIDLFKQINDQYGHTSGDKVIKMVADCIKAHFRRSDIVARYGGEEFCVLTTNLKKDHTKIHFERLRNDLEALNIELDRKTVSITTSIGVTTELAETLPETIAVADEYLYKAKRSGRNCVIINEQKIL